MEGRNAMVGKMNFIMIHFEPYLQPPCTSLVGTKNFFSVKRKTVVSETNML